jgi:hypothetical protein
MAVNYIGPEDHGCVGPSGHHDVVVNGWTVPFLTAIPLSDGRVHLTLDGRFGLDMSDADAEKVLPFVADAIAMALGYTTQGTRARA